MNTKKKKLLPKPKLARHRRLNRKAVSAAKPLPVLTWRSPDGTVTPIAQLGHDHVLNIVLKMQREDGSTAWLKESKIYKALVERLHELEGWPITTVPKPPADEATFRGESLEIKEAPKRAGITRVLNAEVRYIGNGRNIPSLTSYRDFRAVLGSFDPGDKVRITFQELI